MQGLRIVSFHAENVLRIRTATFTPDDRSVIVAGRNMAGKTSIWECIRMAVQGKGAVPADAVHCDEEKGIIRIGIGPDRDSPPRFVITRNVRPGGKSTLRLEAGEGLAAQFKSPQSLLNSLYGELSFDPLEFAKAKPDAQRDMLLDLVELPIDLEGSFREEKAAFEERRIYNRDVERVTTTIGSLPDVPESTPEKRIDTAALAKDLQDIHTAAAAHEDLVRAASEAEERLATLQRMGPERLTAAEHALNERKSELQEFEQRVIKQRSEYEGAVNKAEDALDATQKEISDEKVKRGRVLDAAQAKLEGRIKPDPTEILKTIEDAHRINDLVDKLTRRREYEGELALAEMARDTAQEKLDQVKAQRAAAIEAAKFPIARLGFTDSGVTYKDHPIENASHAELVRLSMCLAMAKNPTLRVVRIQDGNLLDQAGLDVVFKLAAAQDFQVWMEWVGTEHLPDKPYVIIQDGEILEEPPGLPPPIEPEEFPE